VGLAAVLTGGFMLVEVAGGLISGSLALIADAGHMLTDFAALAMAWLAFRMARRPADARRTYGFDRLSVLAAFANGIALFAIAVWIMVEAARRLAAPHEILSGTMLAVAVAGLIVNLVTFRILMGGDRDNLNLRAALLHVVGDLLGSVAAIVAALVIMWFGWTPIDPLLSVLVAVIILRSAWTVVRDSGHILLEGSPPDFDAAEVAADLCAEIAGLAEVRHLHAWSITQERPMVTLEAVLAPGADAEAIRGRIKARLAARFGFDHATVELLHPGEGEGRLPRSACAPI
jgi:cobalt-zinc-cadmium efflux system protein